MSKTHKDQANYYKHHMARDLQYVSHKEKYKIDPDDVPVELRPLIERLEYNYNTALRRGNNRKSIAKDKVIARRSDRAKSRYNFRVELKDI